MEGVTISELPGMWSTAEAGQWSFRKDSMAERYGQECAYPPRNNEEKEQQILNKEILEQLHDRDKFKKKGGELQHWVISVLEVQVNSALGEWRVVGLQG